MSANEDCHGCGAPVDVTVEHVAVERRYEVQDPPGHVVGIRLAEGAVYCDACAPPSLLAEPPDAETVARAFHSAYERLALSFGYQTRKASAVPWEDVPAANRALMIATAEEVARLLAHAAPAEEERAAQHWQDSGGTSTPDRAAPTPWEELPAEDRHLTLALVYAATASRAELGERAPRLTSTSAAWMAEWLVDRGWWPTPTDTVQRIGAAEEYAREALRERYVVNRPGTTASGEEIWEAAGAARLAESILAALTGPGEDQA